MCTKEIPVVPLPPSPTPVPALSRASDTITNREKGETSQSTELL